MFTSEKFCADVIAFFLAELFMSVDVSICFTFLSFFDFGVMCDIWFGPAVNVKRQTKGNRKLKQENYEQDY